MKRSAREKKAAWESKNKATVHTVVFDDTLVKDANGVGKHDESKRKIFYRRGFGSFRIGAMYPVKDFAGLKALLDTPNEKLPVAARRVG
jgi:hypothetical protein